MSRYIDADALKQEIFAHWYTCEEIDETIDAMPTADVVEVVHGEWLKDAEGEIYCSKCGKYTYDRHDEIKQFNGTHVFALCDPRFCGNCGAKMDERREDEV